MIKLENGLTACLISDLSENDTSKIVSQDDSESDDDNSMFATDDEDDANVESEKENTGCSEDEAEEAEMMERLHGKQEMEEKLVDI